jgi:hypothetical protein
MSNAPGVPLKIRRSGVSKQGVGNLTASDTNQDEPGDNHSHRPIATLDAVFGDICEHAERVIVGALVIPGVTSCLVNH